MKDSERTPEQVAKDERILMERALLRVNKRQDARLFMYKESMKKKA